MKKSFLIILTLVIVVSCTSRADRIDTSGKSEGEAEAIIDNQSTVFNFVRMNDDLHSSQGIPLNNVTVVAQLNQNSLTKIVISILFNANSNYPLIVNGLQYQKDGITYSTDNSDDFEVDVVSFDGDNLIVEFSGILNGYNGNSELVSVNMENGIATASDQY